MKGICDSFLEVDSVAVEGGFIFYYWSELLVDLTECPFFIYRMRIGANYYSLIVTESSLYILG
ncbi:MAG: hypothetical protein COB81_05995 [Flavobacteriaceae bacterium]|nr:MAG: hypothetical protein COB81_05995 [Flavobacteriaceae bacterium]